MADTKVSVAQSVNSDGTTPPLRLSRSGDLYVADLYRQWVLEGRVFVVNQGTASTPIDFAETAYDEDQPQFALRVPSGTTIIPLSISVVFEDSPGTDNEVIWGLTGNDIGNGTSSSLTPYNVLSAGGKTTGCTARSLYTGNATAATQIKELDRVVYPFADATTDPVKKFNVPASVLVPIKGADTLCMWTAAGTDGPQGFTTVVYAEFQSTELF